MWRNKRGRHVLICEIVSFRIGSPGDRAFLRRCDSYTSMVSRVAAASPRAVGCTRVLVRASRKIFWISADVGADEINPSHLPILDPSPAVWLARGAERESALGKTWTDVAHGDSLPLSRSMRVEGCSAVHRIGNTATIYKPSCRKDLGTKWSFLPGFFFATTAGDRDEASQPSPASDAQLTRSIKPGFYSWASHGSGASSFQDPPRARI